MTEPTHVPAATPDPQAELLAAIQDLVPAAFPDGSLDVEQLLTAVGATEQASKPASFSFTWPGIEQARAEARAATTATLVPDPDASLNWDTARDVLIEGDNLQVLKLLQSGYRGAAKLIYIDPPYNIGETFTYNDDYSVPERRYLRQTGQVDEQENVTSSKLETVGKKHAPWLSMLLPRLVLARHLLRRDGAILVSIDDNEAHHLRLLLDAVFGAENFVAQLIWKSKSGGANDSAYIAADHEYILVYAKNRDSLEIGRDIGASVTTSYPHEDEFGKYSLERLDKQNLTYSASMDYVLVGPDGAEYHLRHKNPDQPNAIWRWSRDEVERSIDQLVFRDGNVYTKNYEKDGAILRSLLTDDRFGRTRTGSSELRSLFEGLTVFDNPKPTRLLAALVNVFVPDDGLVVDFFAGSGSTGHAIWAQNPRDERTRRWVMVQAPERPDDSANSGQNALRAGYTTIFEIAAERLRRAAREIGDDGLGFRVFRARESSLVIDAPVVATGELTGEEYVGASLAGAQGPPVVEGSDDDAVVWELVLKATGTQLDARVTRREVDGVVVYEFERADGESAGRLFVSLDAFTVETAERLGVGPDDTLILRGDRVADETTLTLAPRLQKNLVLLERVAREVSL